MSSLDRAPAARILPPAAASVARQRLDDGSGSPDAEVERRSRLVPACAVGAVAGIGVFAYLAVAYLTNELPSRWDLPIGQWLHEHSSAQLIDVFGYVTWAGGAVAVVCVSAGGAFLLWRRRRSPEAVFVLAALAGAEALSHVLKLAFGRPRPELSLTDFGTSSFPSGHAMVATAVYGALAFAAWRGLGARPPRVALVIVGASVLIAIGFSRLYLGAHYLSDVLAGFGGGAAWLSACLLLHVRYERRRAVRRS